MACDFCKFNRFSPACDADGKCDFKTIPFTREGILERIKKEGAWLNNIMISDLSKYSETQINDVYDVVIGVKTLMDVGVSEFSISSQELNSLVPKLSKVRLAASLARMKNSRRKKTGGKNES